MCGICGAAGFDHPESSGLSMMAAMVHRGPDSQGSIGVGPFWLGVRRLQIIDLQTGDQPVFNEDQSVAVILNGEIYNYRELRLELQNLGHRFTTQSDTETVVHAYEIWGSDCPVHFQGMFALAILDMRVSGQPGLFLARDRLGIKPLYLWQEKHRLLFASEVRALLASGQVSKQLSVDGLYTYLAFGSVQEPLTLVNGITSLPPAAWLSVAWDGQQLSFSKGIYWQPPQPLGLQPSPVEVRGWLTDAISSHLTSDVPLGAFLSGGVDSGTIVALGSQTSDQAMRTFTLGFTEQPGDERAAALLTAQRYGTRHQSFLIHPAELLTELPQAIASMDQPTVDGINSWYVSREARRAGLTVALSGLGGDELFGGYPSFNMVPRLKFIHSPLLILLARWFSMLYVGTSLDSQRKLRAYLNQDLLFNHPYFAVRGLFTRSQILVLLRQDARDDLAANSSALGTWQAYVGAQMKTAAGFDSVGEISWLELRQYMLSTLLRDTDMMSMAHSLEVRVPFLDHRLVERLLQVNGKWKFKGVTAKPLLVNAVHDLLPKAILRQSKRPFTLPFETWLQAGMYPRLKQDTDQRLQQPLQGMGRWIDPAVVAEIMADFEHGRTNWARPWSLYVLDMWIQQNL